MTVKENMTYLKIEVDIIVRKINNKQKKIIGIFILSFLRKIAR